jgi:adsorption protein B
MAPAVSAALVGAVLAMAAACAHAQPAHGAGALGEFAGVEKPAVLVPPPGYEALETEDLEQAGREPGAEAIAGPYARIALALTIFVAALLFLSGLDDAFIDACYWGRALWRRQKVIGAPGSPAFTRLREKPEAPFAIMVPAWKEHEVIAAMVENTVKTLDYRAFRIFCGVYPNDPATGREVDRMAARYPGMVTRVDVPHDGPTCKGDCLNHIVRRVLAEEHASGMQFAGMVLHDSEDVIHPLELKLFNVLVPGRDLVQLPVFSLDRPGTALTAGTYIDDFAESHGKDIAVREALVGTVPGAGVATCYSRRALAALWKSSGGEPFNTGSLTEDYDLSFRLKRLGMTQTFAHAAMEDAAGARAPGVRGRTGSVISTHEYFPDRFKAAYRQRTRWIIGIAFQGWQHMGWRGSAMERYFLFRDRKVLIMAPAGALAYLLLIGAALGSAFGTGGLDSALTSILALPLLRELVLVNVAFMLNRAVQRMYFVNRYYGRLQGALSVLRIPINNLINLFAVMRAWRLFLGHLVTGKKLAWDKTAHVFPDAATLAPQAPPVPQPQPVQRWRPQPVPAQPPMRPMPAHAARLQHAAAILCALLLAAPQDSIAQPPPLTGRAYQFADRAYRALERGELERALNLSAEALRHAPRHAALLLLQADILGQQGKQAQALELIRDLRSAELGSVGLAQRGYLWLGAGNAAAAEADFAEAVRLGGLSTEARGNVASELAYLALARKDDAAALEWFEMALGSGRAPSAGLYADAGYAATRLGRNDVAAQMLSKAVDAWHAAPDGKKPFDDAALFGMRRSIDSVSRRWGATLSLGHSSTQAAAGSVLAEGGSDLRVVQLGAEVFYTPEGFGYRNERIFQLYANAFQGVSANEEGYATGSDSLVAGLGARYKPFPAHDLVFALERRLALGDRTGKDEWLLRAGWSASRRTDWEPERQTWTTWQVYTESVYFTGTERLVQPFDARIGRSQKLARWQQAVVTPYVGIAGEYDEAQSPRMAAGVGPGVAVRYWFGETRYRAFPSHFDFFLQYRARLTDARRGGGLFGQLSVTF